MKLTKTIIWAMAAAAVFVTSTSAYADHDDRDRDYSRYSHHYRNDHRGVWSGDIRHFREHDMDRWRGGRWFHGRHEGHEGWWWVVAGLWYFYPRPVYPYPDPYTPPTATQYWYYCPPARAYYPYVQSCPGGWRLVPATPPVYGR